MSKFSLSVFPARVMPDGGVQLLVTHHIGPVEVNCELHHLRSQMERTGREFTPHSAEFPSFHVSAVSVGRMPFGFKAFKVTGLDELVVNRQQKETGFVKFERKAYK